MGQTFTKKQIPTFAKSGLEHLGIVSKYDTRYEAHTQEEIQNKLNEYGICYVPDILTNEEKFNMISGTWDFFEHVTKNEDHPINRGNPESWTTFDIFNPGLGMMYHAWNIGHAQYLWDLRQNKKIIDVFKHLYNVSREELLVSFDGMAFLFPPEQTNANWHKEKDCHLHLDQRLSVTKQSGFQSFVTAYDVEEGDATIRFLEGSNKLTKEFVKKFGEFTGGDWVVFQPKHLEYFRERCEEVFLRCPAKSLVIWDSRTVHCGSNPRRTRKHANTRCISYLSYSPKALATELDLSIKKQALTEMLTSNHYAHRASYFPTYPYQDEDIVNRINAPNLSKLGYSLAGYDKEEINCIFE
jgi:hypothetical protein